MESWLDRKVIGVFHMPERSLNEPSATIGHNYVNANLICPKIAGWLCPLLPETLSRVPGKYFFCPRINFKIVYILLYFIHSLNYFKFLI
jgi:hypothetical protein